MLSLGVLAGAVWLASGWWGFVDPGAWTTWGVDDRVAHWRRNTRDDRIATLTAQLNKEPATYAGSDAQSQVWVGVDTARIDATRTRYSFGIGQFSLTGNRIMSVDVLLWPLPLVIGLTAAAFLRSGIVARRRALASGCQSCGYDLRGLSAAAPCPECGKAAALAA